MVSVLAPVSQVALPPFSISVLPFLILMVALELAATAVTLLDALLVSAVYAYIPALKAGVSVSVPIASEDKDASKGLRCLWRMFQTLRELPH